MKKFNLIFTVILLSIIIYAYDQSIEITGTEREKKAEKKAEDSFVNEEVERFKRQAEKKKAKGEPVEETEESVIEESQQMFRNRCQKLRDMIKKDVRDIRFYGRVVDQSTNPIPNALIPFSLTHYNIFTAYKETYFKIYTDDRGFFEITDAKGLKLSFEKPIKEGYEFAKDSRANKVYNYHLKRKHIPSPNNPVLFIMRKTPKKGLMIKVGSSFRTIKSLNCPVYSRFFADDRSFEHLTWKGKWFKEKGYFQKEAPKFKITAYPTLDINVYKIKFELLPNGLFARPDEVTQKEIDKLDYDDLTRSNMEMIPEAPKTGYQSEISVLFTNDMIKPLKEVCFIKVLATKNITLYGKFLFKIINDKSEERPYIDIINKCYLNVVGTRNLLYDDYLNCFERERIKQGDIKAQKIIEERKKYSTKEEDKQMIFNHYKLYE